MSSKANSSPRPFPTSNQIEFGEWFRKERKSRNLTQTDVAQMSGMTRQTVGEIEKGGNVGFFSVLKALKSMGLAISVEESGHQSMISTLFDTL